MLAVVPTYNNKHQRGISGSFCFRDKKKLQKQKLAPKNKSTFRDEK
jgi:hypothetical protein